MRGCRRVAKTAVRIVQRNFKILCQHVQRKFARLLSPEPVFRKQLPRKFKSVKLFVVEQISRRFGKISQKTVIEFEIVSNHDGAETKFVKIPHDLLNCRRVFHHFVRYASKVGYSGVYFFLRIY